MPLTITLDERALRKYIDRSIKSWPEAASDALEKVGRAVFDESQQEVPVGATHRLKSQTFLSIAPHTVLIAYLAPYARYVHFRKRVRHLTGRRMFLGGPMAKGKRILPAMIKDFIQREMDKPA